VQQKLNENYNTRTMSAHPINNLHKLMHVAINKSINIFRLQDLASYTKEPWNIALGQLQNAKRPSSGSTSCASTFTTHLEVDFNTFSFFIALYKTRS